MLSEPYGNPAWLRQAYIPWPYAPWLLPRTLVACEFLFFFFLEAVLTLLPYVLFMHVSLNFPYHVWHFACCGSLRSGLYFSGMSPECFLKIGATVGHLQFLWHSRDVKCRLFYSFPITLRCFISDTKLSAPLLYLLLHQTAMKGRKSHSEFIVFIWIILRPQAKQS